MENPGKEKLRDPFAPVKEELNLALSENRVTPEEQSKKTEMLESVRQAEDKRKTLATLLTEGKITQEEHDRWLSLQEGQWTRQRYGIIGRAKQLERVEPEKTPEGRWEFKDEFIEKAHGEMKVRLAAKIWEEHWRKWWEHEDKRKEMAYEEWQERRRELLREREEFLNGLENESVQLLYDKARHDIRVAEVRRPYAEDKKEKKRWNDEYKFREEKYHALYDRMGVRGIEKPGAERFGGTPRKLEEVLKELRQLEKNEPDNVEGIQELERELVAADWTRTHEQFQKMLEEQYEDIVKETAKATGRPERAVRENIFDIAMDAGDKLFEKWRETGEIDLGAITEGTTLKIEKLFGLEGLPEEERKSFRESFKNILKKSGSERQRELGRFFEERKIAEENRVRIREWTEVLTRLQNKLAEGGTLTPEERAKAEAEVAAIKEKAEDFWKNVGIGLGFGGIAFMLSFFLMAILLLSIADTITGKKGGK